MKRFVEHEYDDIGRLYKFDDGTRYYSVTTMLSATSDKSALVAWRNRIGVEEADRQTAYASSVGTKMHECLEHYMKNGTEPEYYPNSIVKNLCKQILPYLRKRVDTVFASEKVLYSDKMRLAGTVDGVVKYNTVQGPIPFILDFKTSKRVKKIEYLYDYFYQLAIYSMMIEEMYDIKIDHGVLLFAYKEQRSIKNEVIVKLSKYKKLVPARIEKFFSMIKKS